jgi:ribose transport system permease protein
LLGFINGLLLTKLRLPHPFISTMGVKQMARGIALAITAAQPISGFHPSINFFGSARGPDSGLALPGGGLVYRYVPVP